MEELNESECITSLLMSANAADSSSSCSQYLTALNESIEDSKVHWSEMPEVDSDMIDDEIAANNTEVFKILQSHPIWGKLFITFNQESGPSLMVGKKIAEGGQAEIFDATYTCTEYEEVKCVLKVFKKGTFLQHLQSQWPRGYLQWRGEDIEQMRSIFTFRTHVAILARGLLLPTGEFAFLMKKEDEDLRSLIERNRVYCGHGCGPFEKETMEKFIYQIACGTNWLHKRNVVHRDLKSSNVLVTKGHCFLADYECSIGVIGTGFWRDPQILQACRERNIGQRPDLFTRAADVYSYAMTCYEILTGKLPFEGEQMTMDLVIQGQRPKLPEYVDQWTKDLLGLCWQTNRVERPTFEEILNIIIANATSLYIKNRHVWDRKRSNEELNPLLGCSKHSHGLKMLECTPHESGVFMCKLCLKQGFNEALYCCTSCSDFDLHLECASIPTSINSSMHPHDMILLPGFMQDGERIICGACQLEILQGNYYSSYECLDQECDFAMHIHCAKYARSVSHVFHEEHELVLSYTSMVVGAGKLPLVCNCCSIQLDPLEIVYACGDCGFHIHPHCIIGTLECKSW